MSDIHLILQKIEAKTSQLQERFGGYPKFTINEHITQMVHDTEEICEINFSSIKPRQQRLIIGTLFNLWATSPTSKKKVVQNEGAGQE